ncbi:MAG: glycoside hydrolase/phage tail family protein [Hyphomonadaceae bacterium]|nr:glycoside hydrolase/phage tail family protein [Hyphomonadaceae bacterium]
MAQLILSTVGAAIGRSLLPPALQAIGATLLGAAGAAIGQRVDTQIFGATRRAEGPRLSDLHIQSSTEGASIPAIYGRVRIAGQVIWAARFKEHVGVETQGGKGGGARSKTKTYSYSISFAVGLCEGEIARIGRAWANGEAFDLSRVEHRVHRGAEDQAPDPIIEAVEGESAPAYRGLAYIVFEDLPLEQFGNLIPQLSFEIVRPPPSDAPRLEDMVRGVCLIPGSGEFAYATAPVLRALRPGEAAAENVHAEPERANFEVALDHLQADLPRCDSVLLVVAWFGTDLRCGACEIRPGVENGTKVTRPITWSVNGVEREDAYVVSQIEGAPAYGGTPADKTVIDAIASLRARGFTRIGLYPFILMDVPVGNGLPDPYGGAEQAAYPWRGRITLGDADDDKTGAAAAQVDAFFGTAAAGDFAAHGTGVSYSGPDEWSFRRFILHHAKLAEAAGGVDVFIMGSELRGLTTIRDSATNYPAVARLKTLASEVRGIVGEACTLTYAADWSEYFGHQPQDGSGDVCFHLDPLWADEHIDVVGIDWYAPLSDWRDGATHLDAASTRRIYDRDYLEDRIEAGENFDWHYASDADRVAQTRTSITDGAYAKHWVYRAKDVRSWWSNAHYDRPGGLESATPTDWLPESKPIWFTEIGCPAIDKGANAPNLFFDPKSAESAAPPFSSGARDDLIQRRTLEAYLTHWDGEGPVDPSGMFVWAWDARPYPAFPGRDDVWSDGASWRLGHWLNGRAGLAELPAVVGDLCKRASMTDIDVAGLCGAVAGYVADAPASAREALEPLMLAYDFSAGEREGMLGFRHRGEGAVAALTIDQLTEETAASAYAVRDDAAQIPIEARVRFLDGSLDYRIATVSARRRDAAEGGVASLEAPLVLDHGQAEALAKRALAFARAGVEAAEIAISPQNVALEPGDLVSLDARAYEIVGVEEAETRRLSLRRALGAAAPLAGGPTPASAPHPAMSPSPDLLVLDLPPLMLAESDLRPLAGVYAKPWRGPHEVYANATVRGQANAPAIVGTLEWALHPGPVGRWDDGNIIRIRLSSSVESVTRGALLNGANLFAVETEAGWELLQARNATLTDDGLVQLSGFLRGLGDSEQGAPAPVGARIVKIDARLARLNVGAHEFGEDLTFIAPPPGKLASDAEAASVTARIAPVGARPFAPVRLRAARGASGDVRLSWVRCARIGGDSWGAAEPPIGAPAERYLLEILDAGTPVRSVETEAAAYLYEAAAQAADFGTPPGALEVRVAQIGADGFPGKATTRTLFL